MQFTYRAYEKLISLLRDKGYEFSNYRNWRMKDRVVILRHDIDYSLDKAVALAELERELGVSSTYFVLLTSEFYNLLSKDNLSKISKIGKLGHDIGLHFDEVNYSEEYYKDHGGIESVILEEVNLLKQITGIDVDSVFMHRPSKKTLESNIDLGPVINSYGQQFFQDFKYVSDSRRRWREDIVAIINSEKYAKLHILTHAFWYNDIEKDLRASLLEFIESGNTARFSMLDKNITDLNEVVSFNEINA